MFTDGKSVRVLFGNGDGTFKAAHSLLGGHESRVISDRRLQVRMRLLTWLVLDGKSTAFELLLNLGGTRMSPRGKCRRYPRGAPRDLHGDTEGERSGSCGTDGNLGIQR